jgi:hypothetical protein
MWEWIAKHSARGWMDRHGECGLHRFPQAHKRLHAIARVVHERYGGDVRNIWDPNRSTPLLARLEDEIKVGPNIARMIVGALRDHGLVRLRASDFKADRHVQRLMKAVGLSRSSALRDVMAAARRHFDDPWLADACFYHLGADYGVKTKRQFMAVYRAMKTWVRNRRQLKTKVGGLLKDICGGVDGERWTRYMECSPHWVGGYLVKDQGFLKGPMNNEGDGGFWIWGGIGFDGRLVSTLHAGGADVYFPADVRRALRRDFETGSQDGSSTKQREYWMSRPLTALQPLREFALREQLKDLVQQSRRMAVSIERSMNG